MEAIQEKVTEKNGRNLFSQFVNAKNDKETIASWRSDLERILHIFNVRSVISMWLSPTVHFQTELAIITNSDVSDVRRDVATACTVVASTHSLVSAIHRNMLQSQKGTECRQQLVSVPPIHRQHEQNTYYPSGSNQVSDIEHQRV